MDYVSLLIYPGLIALIVIIVVRHSNRKRIEADGKSGVVGSRPRNNLKDLILACLIITAGLSGLSSLMLMPKELLSLDSGGAQFACRIISAVLLILAGLAFKKLTRLFLMLMGIIILVFSLPYVFSNFGSIGALVLIIIAMTGLVVGTIYATHRERKNG